MKALYTKQTIGNSDRWARFLGATLTVALMVPAFVFSQTIVNLGTASAFAVLAAAGIPNTGTTDLTGDIGSYPTATITGFPPGTFTGTNQGGNAITQGAMVDLAAAYDDAAGRTGAAIVATELGGTILTAGVYKSNAGTFGITGTLTLDAENNPNAVFIFQMATTLTTAANSSVSLINGAQWANIFWQVGSSATLGTTSVFKGNILALASITLTTGATLDGSALAQTGAVTLDGNSISKSATVGVVENGLVPQKSTIFQSYRNQSIEFTVPSNGRTTLIIMNTLGQKVATLFNGEAKAGRYNQVQFNTRGLAKGLYLSKLEFNGKVNLKKILLFK
ncbi:MAG: DUF3494 domain-containing protein [Chitinispirillaceae bacterium]|nr:DUF3494 domain-containing protein [Chitinispirillaceae bacterium]